VPTAAEVPSRLTLRRYRYHTVPRLSADGVEGLIDGLGQRAESEALAYRSR